MLPGCQRALFGHPPPSPSAPRQHAQAGSASTVPDGMSPQSTVGSPIPPAIVPITTIPHLAMAAIMQEDDAPRASRFTAANDNDVVDPAAIDAALRRIAEAIGRHIAREHIRARKAANDNEARNA